MIVSLKNVIEPKSFEGKHILQGVDLKQIISVQEINDFISENEKSTRFMLDDVVYEAIVEDCDGLRDSMKGIYKSNNLISNVFDCNVEIEYTEDNYFRGLIFKNTINNKIIFKIGTDESDSYYPYYTAELFNENM